VATEENLREQILRQVRAEIIAGHVPPGAMYSAPNLAASLGTSTTPAREALLELVRIGLLKAQRNRGFKVVEPSIAEIRHIFELREVLEIHAAAALTGHPEADFSTLRPEAEALASAARNEDFRAYLEFDRAFHRRLVAAAGNPLLTEMVMGLRDKMRLYGLNSPGGLARQKASIDEHFAIIDLAEARRFDALCSLLRGHIRVWEEIFVENAERYLASVRRRPLRTVSRRQAAE
jgi:DNA-binding GntR family transcriptional regulator